MLHKYLTNPIKLAIVALLVVVVSSANAEWKQSTQSQGNNVGLTVSTSYGGPMRGGTPSQFPRGSGNTYKQGRWNWGINVVRDPDGDGVADDTLANLSRAGRFPGMLCSLEALDLLTSLATGGEDMGDASTRISTNRIYTTSDPGDVADWPAWFREGRSSSGAPIWHGAETIVANNGDCFNEDQAMGASIEWRMHFLNFAESNNMIYTHVFFRNMSEMNKWNGNSDITDQIANTAETGQVWTGMQLNYNYGNGFLIGGRDEAWAYYFPREIIVVADRNGIEGSFTTHPAMVAMMPLRMPELNGQTLTFTNTCAHGWSTEYGLMQPEEVLEGGYPMGRAYRFGNGRYDPTAPFYEGYTNPWTGGPVYGWPGVPLPDEDRYDQWWWGTANAYNSYNFWGEFTDVAPRDSFSLDCVYAFVQPKNPPFTFPPSDLPNLDNPEVQDQLSTVQDYMDVAEIVSAGGFILPETPAPPPLTIIPGEKQVTITWSDINVNTPDAYYGFLQDNPSLDPDGQYIEYDFEGFRLYRSFVGPSDSHSELIWEGSLSGGDLQFYYVDTRDSDNPLFRMNNGMRVWYALVPYDNNYDPGVGAYFSLPDPASGKLWNRPGAQLYTVQPRSNASNFRAAELAGYSYEASGSAAATISQTITTTLSGSSGLLTQAPVYLEPQMDLTLTPIIDEKITSEIKVSLVVTGWGPNGVSAGRRYIALADASGNIIDDTAPFVMVRSGDRKRKTFMYHYGVASDGATLAISGAIKASAGYRGDAQGHFHTQIDLAGYSGADVNMQGGNWGFSDQGTRYYRTSRHWQGLVKGGAVTISFASGGSGITATVVNTTRGETIPFSPYIDDGWGFVPPGENPYSYLGDFGVGWNGQNNNEKPQADRSKMLVESMPVDNTETFSLYVNGQFWTFSNVTGMPASGTVMTATTAFGNWNGDENQFTQYPDPVQPGDKWNITVNPSSMDPNDADLSKIMVVPNPYMASSALDLSPSQRRLEFVNLPARCTIRIYSLGGHLVNVLNHIGANRHGWGDYSDYDRLDASGGPREFVGWDNHGGTEAWNLQNRFGQTVASGLYFYHVTDERGETHTGKFYVIN
jgi:hypothetical protein